MLRAAVLCCAALAGALGAPTLSENAVATIEQAEALCTDGTFLKWGQYLDEQGVVQSLFPALSQVNSAQLDGVTACVRGVKPEYTGTTFTYVVDDLFIFEAIPSRSRLTCADVDAESLSDISCDSLQLYCQQQGMGWLTFGQTYANSVGKYQCAGCTDGGFITGPEPQPTVSLTTWPLLMLYGFTSVLFVGALFIDYKVYMHGEVSLSMKKQGDHAAPDLDGDGRANTGREWLSRFVLYNLGYSNLDGTKNYCCGQCCQNRLCGCISSAKIDGGLGLLTFVSLFFLSLGVSVLLKGGKGYATTCYFKAEGSKYLGSEEELSKSFLQSFTGEPSSSTEKDHFLFGQYDPVEYGLSFVFELDFAYFTGEALAFIYQICSNMMSHALADANIMSQRKSMALICLLSMGFCGASILYDWDNVRPELLWQSWALGFLLLVIFIGPVAAGMGYFIGSCLVCFKCLDKPPEPPMPWENAGGTVQPEALVVGGLAPPPQKLNA